MTKIIQPKILTSLLLTCAIGASGLPPILAQDPPAKTFQPGFWQPVGRFNPKQNMAVKMVNETGITLNYDVTSLETDSPQDLGNGQNIILKDLGDSAYIMVYPVVETNPDDPFNLKFTVNVDEKDNLVTITMGRAEQGFIGHRTINLQKTGAIYFY
jgi:hypothetical protein